MTAVTRMSTFAPPHILLQPAPGDGSLVWKPFDILPPSPPSSNEDLPHRPLLVGAEAWKTSDHSPPTSGSPDPEIPGGEQTEPVDLSLSPKESKIRDSPLTTSPSPSSPRPLHTHSPTALGSGSRRKSRYPQHVVQLPNSTLEAPEEGDDSSDESLDQQRCGEENNNHLQDCDMKSDTRKDISPSIFKPKLAWAERENATGEFSLCHSALAIFTSRKNFSSVIFRDLICTQPVMVGNVNGRSAVLSELVRLSARDTVIL